MSDRAFKPVKKEEDAKKEVKNEVGELILFDDNTLRLSCVSEEDVSVERLIFVLELTRVSLLNDLLYVGSDKE